MSRFRTIRQQLHISIDPYRSDHPDECHDRTPFSPVSTSSPSPRSTANTLASRIRTTSRTTDVSSTVTLLANTDRPEWLMCSVLCLHDFESDDPDHLSFRQNEILDIAKQEATGWWAAIRQNGNQVGWIPSTFVAVLQIVELNKLQKVPFDLRIYEYDAQKLYNSAPLSNFHHLYSPNAQSPDKTRVHDWVPVVEAAKAPIPQLRLLNDEDADRGPNFTVDVDVPSSARLSVPPSPSTPTPQPPSTTAPLLINKLTSPTPTSISTYIPVSNPRDVAPSSPDATSTSLSGRIQRRRPVLVDDHLSLSRLSTLMGTGDMKEVEILTSPQMSGSFDAFSRALGKKSDDMIQPPAPDAVHDDAKPEQFYLPWYLRPNYSPDTLQMDSQGRVKAGTLPALIERLTEDSLIDVADETTFRNAFLMTFRSFTSAEIVFEMLVQRYQMSHPTSLTSEELEDWTEKKLRPVQQMVLNILAMWLENHHLIEEGSHMKRKLTEFLTLTVIPSSLGLIAKAIQQSLECLTFTRPQTPPIKRKKSKAHKKDLLRFHPADMAEQLCLHEYNLYTMIQPQECLNWAKTQSGDGVTNMVNFCATHEKLAAWVKISILNNEVLGKRVDIVDFWIKVAEKCRSLNNFASMSAIVTALSSAVVSKLHLTWALVSRKSYLDTLLKFNEPAGRFSGYRTLLQSVEGACVPFLTMFLTDIVHIEDKLPNNIQSTTVQEPLIFFYKRQRWYDVVSAMLRYQSKPYSFAENDTTKKFIEEHLRTATQDQGWFWTRSREVQHSELAHTDIRKGLEAAGF